MQRPGDAGDRGGTLDPHHANYNNTFRQRRNTPVGAKGLQLKRVIDATLGMGNYDDAVKLPPGEDMNEWFAVNVVDFFNAVSMLYETLREFCTLRTCEVMSAKEGKYEYLWADGVKYKKPTRLSAPEYINCLFDWVEQQVDNPHLFPQQFGQPFPPSFMELIKAIMKRLFRVYAHIYHSHFNQIVMLGEDKHLNSCFKHFMFFVLHFNLIDEKELYVLKDLIFAHTGRVIAG